MKKAHMGTKYNQKYMSWGGPFYFKKCQLINVEEVTQLLASMTQEIHMASLYLSLYILLINCKRETEERADAHHLQEVITLGISDNGTN